MPVSQGEARRVDKPRTDRKMVQFAMPPDQHETLCALAAESKTSFSEQLRTVIEWGLESMEKSLC